MPTDIVHCSRGRAGCGRSASSPCDTCGDGPRPTSPAAATAEAAAESTEGLFIMKSPIVGTFYSSPSPNAPPFVKRG